MSFSTELRKRRREKNISQSELGRVIGVTQSIVSSYESGVYRPTFECLLRISKALECSVDDLVKDEVVDLF